MGKGVVETFEEECQKDQAAHILEMDSGFLLAFWEFQLSFSFLNFIIFISISKLTKFTFFYIYLFLYPCLLLFSLSIYLFIYSKNYLFLKFRSSNMIIRIIKNQINWNNDIFLVEKLGKTCLKICYELLQ